MAGGRKDWSALSSLARQWTLEDEEEQERERRRRHRTLSSATDDEAPRLTQNGDSPAAERLPSVEEAEVPKPRTSVSKDEDEDVQAILRTRQERRQRRQAVEAAQAPGQPEAGAGRERSGPGQAKQQPLGPSPSGEQRGPRAGEDESPGGRGSAGGKEEVSGKPAPPEKPLAPAERLVSAEASGSAEALGPQRTSAPEKRAIREKKSLLERTGVPEKPPAPGKTSDPERRLVSEKASLFEKCLASQKTPAAGSKLAPRRAGGQPAPGGSQPAAAGQPGRALPDESPPSSAEQGEQRAPEPPTAASSRLPPITLQVKIPSKEGEVDTLSPTQATYSSSLRRSSPRTISFRMSPRRDNPETTLTRSASMRLPAGTAKLGEKLERYHTAVQRSESVKSPGSSRTEFFVAPVGVASKRHLFEKELLGQGRAEVASGRKENLKLSGVVTSRLNLWISRTQESGEQDPQEVGKESVATKRTQWGRKADSSLDAEV